MNFLGGDFVDWDAEIDPFPAEPLEWEAGTVEGKRLLDTLLEEENVHSVPSPQGSVSLESEVGSEAKRGRAKGSGRTANETEEERKDRLAAACRRFRARRKEEINQLKRKNEEMETERELYLAKIADLQSEAQALRSHGTVDLAKENDLLRVEIRKHKRFIQTLVSAAQNAPLVTPEEKYRILSSGVSSDLGQALGLMYTSTVDPNWKDGEKLDSHGVEIFTKYQVLPLGAPVAEAKRVNYRMDMPCLPHSLETLSKKIWRANSDEAFMKQMHLRTGEQGNAAGEVLLHGDVIDFKLEEVFPELQIEDSVEWKTESIRVFRYEEVYDGRPSVDVISACAQKDCSLNVSAIPENYNLVDGTNVRKDLMPPTGQVEGKVFISSSSPAIQDQSSQIAPKVDGVKRIDGPMLDATFILPLSNDTRLLSFVMSFPILEGGFLGMSKEDAPVVSEGGKLSTIAKSYVEHFVTMIFAEEDQ